MRVLHVFLVCLLPLALAAPADPDNDSEDEFEMRGALPSTGCGTLCGSPSSESLTPAIQALRDSSSCTLDNARVEAIAPGAATNPQNVKNVEAIFPESKFNEFFPRRNSAYTYTNFLRAIGKYPAICKTAANCPKILAGMFAHFQQETAGLFYLEEINKGSYCAAWSDWVTAAYPCVQGQKYFGRGAKQLSWNYNYGAFSKAMFGDSKVLLKKPGLVATTWLNFASSMWFYVTPQPPKPSMLQVVTGMWSPNGVDTAANLKPGFGATTMIINGGLECGGSPSNPTGASNRAKYYQDFAGRLGADIRGEKLTCQDSQAFSVSGSAGGLSLYRAPESSCSLVTWQTAYSALVEGDYNSCMGLPAAPCGAAPTTAAPATAAPTTAAETTAPFPTAGPGKDVSGDCAALLSGKSGWSGAFGATLNLPVTAAITSFSVEVETSAPVTKLTFWDADTSPASGTAFTATNKGWFGGKQQGETLALAFQVTFRGSEPAFTSIKLNGVRLC